MTHGQETIQPQKLPLPIKVNNFDLIRLFAALQVMLNHGISHLHVTKFVWIDLLSYFPGVPIFFIISGFLISMSWERAPSLRQYALNRALRIYPALWVCLFASIAIFISAGVRPDSARNFLAWLAAQLTFFQFYNPDFLRGFGVGVLNGSLWTITVELQFYAILPLIMIVAKKSNFLWIILILASVILAIVTNSSQDEQKTIFQKLLHVSILSYLFFFLIGVRVRYLYEKYPSFFTGKCFYWFAIYVFWRGVETTFFNKWQLWNNLSVISILLLSVLIVSVAFSKPALSEKLLRKNDISYGMYIYHMPIINLLLSLEMTQASFGFVVMLVLTITISMISWKFVEQPALALKKYSY